MDKKIKRVVSINDMSGIGRCSLTVAIPILSVLGHQCCPFPTAILSCQTGYSEFSFLDFTTEMESYKGVWERLNIDFDCIYSGFLGSEKQISIVLDFVKKHNNSLIVVDPVMGDHGKIYSTYTENMCRKIKDLVKHADIITPNLTEACILTGKKYSDIEVTEENIYKLAKELSDIGPKKVVITGIAKESELWNCAYDKEADKYFIVKIERAEKYYGGTGDIFASIVTGMILKGFTFKESIEKASDFIYKVIKYTSELDTDIKEGVIFEPFLKELIY